MTFALFDLDNTLLAGDSDYEWGQYLVDKGLVDKAVYEAKNQYFFEQYKQGSLDIHAYSAFSFEPLSRLPLSELQAIRQAFVTDIIEPMIAKQARQQVDQHRQQGHKLAIITATNSFVTRPIADLFGIDYLLATEPKIVNGKFTQVIDGTPCFQEGKVERFNAWRGDHTLAGSYFYSDSHNDLPLLRLVENPVAVDPDDQLKAEATANGWSIISLR